MLRWVVSQSSSSLHAAYALVCGQTFADKALFTALRQPAEELAGAVAATLPGARLWPHLLAHAADVESNFLLARLALQKQGEPTPSPDDVSRLAAGIAGCETVFRTLRPDLVKQLELRSRPLREQWEARGPGLLHQLARLTDEQILVERADVVMIYPALGGGGRAHLLNNSVRIEALLYNTIADLSETVRLGWMLSQLNLDLPRFSEGLPRQRLAPLAALAMVPPTLSAAAQVELVRGDDSTMGRALEAWRIFATAPPPSGNESRSALRIERLVDVLANWWSTYETLRLDWPSALLALYRMLEEDGQMEVIDATFAY